MEARLGTNPFPDRIGIMREQSSNVKTADPTQFKKAFGDKSIDQVLNGLTDPSFSAKSRRVNGVGNPELGKDAFFKLMLEQLKQQDPTNPLKSHEMAAQLAQFSSVEQLSNISESVKALGAKDENSQYQLLNLIGKVVSGDSSKIKRVNGDKEHRIEFELAGPAEKAIVKIKDATGNQVKRYEVAHLQAGKNSVVWGGLSEDGKDLPVGDYTAEISAQMGGRKITVNTQFKGAVDGVQFSASGPMLMVEGKSMALKDVSRIEVNGQKSPAAVANHYQKAAQLGRPTGEVETLPASADQPQEKVIDLNQTYSQGAVTPKPVLANLSQLNMDQGLRDKLIK